MTDNQTRLRRSVLFMPGNNSRALEKARSLPADALIFDLEDSVAPADKATARTRIGAAVNLGGYGRRELAVRVNALGSNDFKADLAFVATLGVNAVVVPKVQSVEHINTCVKQLDRHAAPAELSLWAMIETPRAVLDVGKIAASHARLRALILGTEDLAKETRIASTPDRFALVPMLVQCVVAARANGLDVVDGVYRSLDDEAGFVAACEQGRALGFDGKTLIHPKQIDAANRAFAPTDAVVAEARQIVAAWQQSRSQGKGITVVDGKMVEHLHVEEAQRILALRAAIEQRAADAPGGR